MIMCAITLVDARALFAPYLLALIFALFCLNKDLHLTYDRRSKSHLLTVLASAVAGVFISLANHALWMAPNVPDDLRTPLFVRLCKLLILLIIMSGAFCCAYCIMVYVVYDECALKFDKKEAPKRPYLYFLVPFAVIASIYLIIYFSCYYPGLLSLDSIDQIDQLFTGKYSNHQPFYHTMLVGLFIRCALTFTSDMNMAVAFYIIFQIVFMAATFAFVVYNTALLSLPKWTQVLFTVWYAIMPFHIMYSFTLWKDVYFGAFVTLFIVFFIRLMTGIGKGAFNYIGFTLCGPVICLIRSNGMFAYIFVFLAVLILLRKQRKLLVIMGVTLVACFILKHSVLGAVGVTPPDTVESLSIPLQQVARVIVEDGNMDSADMELIGQIIDIDALRAEYDSDISDPVKNLIRDYGNQAYLTQHLNDFALLYLRTFVHNPAKYITSWVDSTCGYWNSGYNYWVWYWDIEDNPFGIERSVASPLMLHIMDGYLWLYYNNRVLQNVLAVGLFVWMLFILTIKAISEKNVTAFVSMVPILAIWLSLLISSPVYAEFRYMYALFCALPVLIAIACNAGPASSGNTHTADGADLYNGRGTDEDNM